MFLRWVDFQPFLLKQWRQRQIFTETSSASSLDLRKLPTCGGMWSSHCEPNIWDELTLMQKGLSKTWSVGLCFFSYIFLANILWRHFSLNLWAVLNLNFRGLFPFSSKCWASGWLVGPRVNYCGMKVTTELLTRESIQCRSSHHVDTFTFQYLSGHYGFGD